MTKLSVWMRQPPRALLAGGLCLAALNLAACGGSSGLLSADQSSSLNAQLSQVSDAVSSGQCSSASSAADGLSAAVGNLGGVNARLTQNLQQAASTVSVLARSQCTSSTSTTSTSTSTTATTSSSPSTSSSTMTSSSSTAPSSSPSTATTSSATGTSPGNGGAPIGGGTATGGSPGAGSGGSGIGNGNGQ